MARTKSTSTKPAVDAPEVVTSVAADTKTTDKSTDTKPSKPSKTPPVIEAKAGDSLEQLLAKRQEILQLPEGDSRREQLVNISRSIQRALEIADDSFGGGKLMVNGHGAYLGTSVGGHAAVDVGYVSRSKTGSMKRSGVFLGIRCDHLAGVGDLRPEDGDTDF